MAILRTEVSNPLFTPDNVTLLTLHSSHIDGRRDVSVYGSNSTSNNVPIIILLHGVYGSHWVWMHSGGVHLVYEQLRRSGLHEFLLVMPSDGGLWDGSGYLPLTDQGNYEQWIVEDVITGVCDTISCASERSKVFISGLSMGGYGALRLGAKYPNRFSGISAHSAVTSLADLQTFINHSVAQYQTSFERESELVYWLQKNKTQLPPLRFDCGRDDPLINSNRTLAKSLKDLGINCDYEEFDGGHEWSYWHTHVAQTLRFFEKAVGDD